MTKTGSTKMCSGVLLRFLLVLWYMAYARLEVPAEFVVPEDVLEGIEELCPGARICGRGAALNGTYERCCAGKKLYLIKILKVQIC